MPIAKKQQACVARYKEKHYDRLNILLPAGRKEAVEDMAGKKGISVNGLINSLLADACGLSLEEWKNQE